MSQLRVLRSIMTCVGTSSLPDVALQWFSPLFSRVVEAAEQFELESLEV